MEGLPPEVVDDRESSCQARVDAIFACLMLKHRLARGVVVEGYGPAEVESE